MGRLLRDVAARLAVRRALAAGERKESKLADAGFGARHPARPPGTIRKDDPRFAELRADWIDVLECIVRPALREMKEGLARLAKRGAPPDRCCLLWREVLDLSSLGRHGDGSERSGEVFTRELGFIDLGHARETADVTLWGLTQLQDAGGAAENSVIKLLHGTARLKRDIPIERRLTLAQQLAYVDSVAHEVETFGLPLRGWGQFVVLSRGPDLQPPLRHACRCRRVPSGRWNRRRDHQPVRPHATGGRRAIRQGGAPRAGCCSEAGLVGGQGTREEFFALLKRNFRAVPWLIDDHGKARIGRSPLLVEPPPAGTDFDYESTWKHVKGSSMQATIDQLRSSVPSTALSP